MGHYTTCDVCGAREKGYATFCGCRRKRTLETIKKRVGAMLVCSFLFEDDPYRDMLYEKWEKGEDLFYTVTILSRANECESTILECSFEDFPSMIDATKVNEKEVEGDIDEEH